jgi:hypothetical protein
MPFALFYISRNNVPETAHSEELAKILDVSLEYNRAHAITGALVSTPVHYAQILEGPRGAVGDLMRRIETDPRHRDISFLARETLPQRSFPRWSLAHVGSSRELESAIERMANRASQGPSPGEVWSLWNLMSDLAHRHYDADPSSAT